MPETHKKRILFMLPALDAGGAERVLITLMNHLDTDQFETGLISVAGQGDLTDLIGEQTQLIGLDQALSPKSYFSLLKAAKSFRPDVIVSTMTHMNFAALALKPFLPKTKFIVREAITPSFFLQKYPKYAWLLKTAYKALYPLADLVLSPTQKVFEEFERNINLRLSKAYVLKNPVRINHIRSQIKLFPSDLKREKTVHFIACGRLGRQKGFDRLIIKLSALKIKFDWRLDIVGEGHERPILEALIKTCNLEGKVFLRGLVMPPYSYMASADCFVMPSRFEGLPNAVLESLACGTQVIATAESGGIAEITAENMNGSITITNTMDEFIAEMNKVLPSQSTEIKPCLVSQNYDEASITAEFSNLLA